MTNLAPPPITSSGNYDPVALFEFLSRCQKSGMPTWQVAETLSVSIDRATYALGNGFEQFRRRAALFQGLT